MVSLIKWKNIGEGSHLRKGHLIAGMVLTVLLFSAIGFAIDILPDRSGYPLVIEDHYSVPLGHLKLGVVIRGSYQVHRGSMSLFIANEGNHSRWLSGLTHQTYSLSWNFEFTIPYEDDWYAVFDFHSTFPWFEYEIHIGSLGFLTAVFTIPGIILAIIIGIAFIAGGRLEPGLEPTTRPIYGKEITRREVGPRIPEFVCPNCGHGNPRDADFCIGCGQDLDLADEVSR